MRHVSRGVSCDRHTAAGLFGRRIRAASLRSLAGVAMHGATLALSATLVAGTLVFTLSSTAFAQESATSASSDAGAAALADTTPAAATAPETAGAGTADPQATDTHDVASTQVLNTPADVVSMNDIPLDDQILARQRGGASGLTMVAATPDLLRGSSVTLWDEIAPPAPLPVPVDAARTAQSNAASYLRK
ncbi:hypothetical protein [Paraburkholderia edwinii]|uniref:hypothetical protein n=1 Tax=Paraburkholderia edwinii TaxID=2861782 RepID=UPI001FE4BA3B|nr:hypothetical protein [Paraburkholderia edwinii]